MKLTKLQRDRLRRYVLDGMLMRLSPEENLIYIRSKINLKLSDRYVRHMRNKLKQERLEEYKKLKMQRYDFVLQYLERIEEIRNLQKKQWDMFNDNEGNVITQQMCLKELHSLTNSLANLYDILPAISLTESNQYYDQGNQEHQVVSSNTEERGGEEGESESAGDSQTQV